MIARLSEVAIYRSMLWSLTQSELRTRYKGSFFGFLWTLMNPLLMLVVYNTVFSTVLRFNVPHYAAFLFIGLLAWNLFSTSVLSASGVIIRQSSLVKKIYFPREILPLSVIGGSLINYLLSLVVMVPFLCFSGYWPSWTWTYFVPIILIELIFTLGMSLLVGSLNVVYRDIEHMLNIIMMAWFYITPVFYATSMIPDKYRIVYTLNPMSGIIISLQDVFYYHTSPDPQVMLLSTIQSLIVLVIGFVTFVNLSKRFAEEV